MYNKNSRQKQEKSQLSEERQNEICICDCGYYPLKHFEECPKCRCMAFHFVINKFTYNKYDYELYPCCSG